MALKDDQKKRAPATTKPNPLEMLRTINGNPMLGYREAYDAGMSLSAWLEKNDPSEAYTGEASKMDAFQRVLAAGGIVTKSDPLRGIWASRWGDLASNKQHSGLRSLVPEFVARQWRMVQHGQPQMQQRSLYTSGDGIIGSWERPYADAASGRWDKLLAPQIPLSWLIAITTPISESEYRIYYLQEDTTEERQSRISEGANIPVMMLKGAEHVVNLLKYGGGLEATYEVMRRQRIDKMSMHIQRMAVRSEVDKVSQILGVMVNGDGNSGTGAIAHTQTGLHSGSSSGTLTLRAYLNFLMQFEGPYMCTGIIAQNQKALDVQLLDTGNANIPLAFLSGTFGSVTPVNQAQANTPIAWTADAPANKLVGFDGRLAIERVVEIGSTIAEVERYVRRQTEAIYMTETEGFGKMDKNSVRTLDINS